MECSEYRRLISRMIDGECDASRRESIAAHLGECEGCRTFLESIQEISAFHRELGELDAPRSLVREVMDDIVEPRRRSRFAGLIRAAVPVAAAVVLVLGIYAGSYLVELYRQPVTNGQLAALELEYLDEYPPESMGDLLMEVTEGGSDERGE